MQIIKFICLILFMQLTVTWNNLSAHKELELVTPQRVVLNDLMEGDTVYYDVQLKNIGIEVVDILKVRATCKCTILNFKPGQLKPNEIMTIPVAINTRGMKNRVTKSISIQTSLDEQELIKVFFELNVTQELDINPPYVNFQDGVVGKEQKQILYFKNNMNIDMQIEEIEVDDTKEKLNNFNIEYTEKKIKPGETVSVNFSFLPDKPLSHYQILLLHIKGTSHSPYKIPVYIMVHDNE